MYIYREILSKLELIFSKETNAGLILTGIVGCGKTTAVQYFLNKIKDDYDVFSYTGDDLQFRQNISHDSRFIINEIKAKATRPAFVFVDEVQKSEYVFDALKIAFDEGKISFLLTGSNPAYLSTVAKKRLQRRADQVLMLPISLRELAIHLKVIDDSNEFEFEHFLREVKQLEDIKLPILNLSADYKILLEDYFKYGGLPLVLLAKDEPQKLREIRLVTERGFDLMVKENNSLAETIRVELAKLQSQEFTYKHILDQTRTRQRSEINNVIDELSNHGYLFKKTPLLLFPRKSSYLSVFSYTDPGIVTYLNFNNDLLKGFQIEGYIHSRLSSLLYNSVYKAELHYFKPHELDSNNNVRYQPGEIDFIYSFGKRKIPIEVKSTSDFKKIDLSLLSLFIKKQKCPFGIVLYEGLPYIDYLKKILFWPYWLV